MRTRNRYVQACLLGGCKHDRLPCYATGEPSLYPQERLAKKMDYYLWLGFCGIKVGAGGPYPDLTYVAREAAEPRIWRRPKVAFIRAHCLIKICAGGLAG